MLRTVKYLSLLVVQFIGALLGEQLITSKIQMMKNCI